MKNARRRRRRAAAAMASHRAARSRCCRRTPSCDWWRVGFENRLGRAVVVLWVSSHPLLPPAGAHGARGAAAWGLEAGKERAPAGREGAVPLVGVHRGTSKVGPLGIRLGSRCFAGWGPVVVVLVVVCLLVF